MRISENEYLTPNVEAMWEKTAAKISIKTGLYIKVGREYHHIPANAGCTLTGGTNVNITGSSGVIPLTITGGPSLTITTGNTPNSIGYVMTAQNYYPYYQSGSGGIKRIFFILDGHEFESLNDLTKALKLTSFL